MLIENKHNRTIFGGIEIFERKEFFKLAEIRKRLILKHKRLRQTIVEFLGSHYFKEIPIEIAERAIIKLEGIHTKEELEQFCGKACTEKFKEGEPFWKM